MSTEIELKLQLSPKAARQLAKHPLLANIPAQRQHLLNTYFDTPKLELHKRRVAVRFRKKGWQWLCTVKSAEPASGGLAMRSEWETQATPGTFDFSHVDNAEFRSFLEARIDQLEPVFTTDFKRQIWHVPFGESLIELAIDRGWIESRGKRLPLCEIELELISGKVDDIFWLTRQLQGDHHLLPAIASKAERGYNLFLDTPLHPFKAKPPAVHADQTPVEAFRCIALNCLEHFQRNEQGLLTSKDPEFVHQARVALRRLRSAIKLFAPVLPSEFVTIYGQTWQTLGSALGEARNWDVFLEETLPPIVTAFPNDKDIKRLRKSAQRKAQSARKAVIALLAVDEYPRLLLEFTAAVYTVGQTLPIPLADFARQQIARHARKARKLAIRHAELTPSERHNMRIAFKKLRYTLEFCFAKSLSKKQTHYFVTLTRLQDILGKINDYVTAEEILSITPGNNNHEVVTAWIRSRHSLAIAQLPEILKPWFKQHIH
ncbi:CYTH and CHAD domain-containing protein [Dechloromonas sp. XY25]|uniref:CYTH and CHAD domain-containing protein n=1 Tax=Dechloromonas hankyongensis TaxID=2908002 RepID=A0ABS9K0K7_9RHOO|nr:CYTH and CHAD domain-containing protein [Dechloromonas hankyongensis]MCG2576651.1 CYTH and CHAD domain-containing protein [Dechloromonas hankyongensis]